MSPRDGAAGHRHVTKSSVWTALDHPPAPGRPGVAPMHERRNLMSLLFDHIVVLMLENRSFDHLFGFLGIGDGIPAGGITNYLTAGDNTTQALATREGGDFVAVRQGPSHSL